MRVSTPPPRPHHQVQVLPASQLLRSGRRLSGWAKAASKADPKIVLKLSELPHGVSTNQVVCAATMVVAHTCRAFATADDVRALLTSFKHPCPEPVCDPNPCVTSSV